jgi:hypothetical protein
MADTSARTALPEPKTYYSIPERDGSSTSMSAMKSGIPFPSRKTCSLENVPRIGLGGRRESRISLGLVN